MPMANYDLVVYTDFHLFMYALTNHRARLIFYMPLSHYLVFRLCLAVSYIQYRHTVHTTHWTDFTWLSDCVFGFSSTWCLFLVLFIYWFLFSCQHLAAHKILYLHVVLYRIHTIESYSMRLHFFDSNITFPGKEATRLHSSFRLCLHLCLCLSLP